MESLVPMTRITRVTGEQGFLLLELLVSIVLIMLLVPFLVGLELNAVKLNRRAKEVDGALWAALSKVEELRTLGYDGISAGSDELVLPDGNRMVRTWSLQEGQPAVKMRTITVTSAPVGVEAAQTVQLAFVMTDRS